MNRAAAHTDHASIARFIALLHRTIGLDAESIGAGAIERAVRERLADWRAHGHAGASLDDYWYALNTDPARLQDLIEAVVVPETWFFRDPEAFAALVRLAKARLRDAPFRPVRVLSLPCSSGEEAYSAAMAMLDAGFAPEQFVIEAIDVSERALARARRAHYGRNAFRGHALSFRERHFTASGDGWQLDPRVARSARFTQTNLLKLDPATYESFDFIFCRNVLIYFDRDTQRAALRVIDGLLADGGTLFVGPAETGLLMREGMSSAKIPLAFAFRRVAAEVARVGFAPSPALGEFASPLARREFAPSSPPARAAFVPMAAPPRVQATSANLVPTPSTTLTSSALSSLSAPSLAHARALADAGKLAQAASAARGYLDAHPSSADAYYLLGVIADAQGDADDARANYKRALYLDPAHGEALTHLAAVLELDGDEAGARRLLERAGRVGGRRS
jgi:chemotaxis protein methyltransferase WspC